MIEDLLESIKKRRSDGQDARRKARKEEQQSERNRLFHAATTQFQEAIADLERTLRAVRRQQKGYSVEVCRILEALSQTYGSLGGTWRDAGNLRKAIEMYDKGNSYEDERRQNCVRDDTYNMLQRLIVRLLEDPGQLEREAFMTELESVRDEIDRQVDAGRNDSWAMADQVLARFLCGGEARTAIAELERRKADSSFYESAANVITALVGEGLGKGTALGDRLDSFKRLLQRRGGLP